MVGIVVGKYLPSYLSESKRQSHSFDKLAQLPLCLPETNSVCKDRDLQTHEFNMPDALDEKSFRVDNIVYTRCSSISGDRKTVTRDAILKNWTRLLEKLFWRIELMKLKSKEY